MNNSAQLDIFAVAARRAVEAPPYRVGSETSRQAAQAIAPRAGTLRERVYEAILAAGPNGCTDNEGIEASGIGGSTWRPRRVELVAAGRIRPAPEPRDKSTVWVAAAGGGQRVGP